MIVARPGPGLLAACAGLHAAAFAGAARGWAAAEIGALAASPGVALACDGAPPAGFALVRVAADEAELLTLAVDPASRRQGRGARLLAAAEGWARDAGAAAMLLEVAADNVAARALYAARGYVQAGARPDYYRRPGKAVAALLLRRPL